MEGDDVVEVGVEVVVEVVVEDVTLVLAVWIRPGGMPPSTLSHRLE